MPRPAHIRGTGRTNSGNGPCPWRSSLDRSARLLAGSLATTHRRAVLGDRFAMRWPSLRRTAPGDGTVCRLHPVVLSGRRAVSFSRFLPQVALAARDGTAAQEYFLWDLLQSEKDNDPPCFSFCFALEQNPTEFSCDGITLSFLTADSFLEPFQAQLVCRESEGSLGAGARLRWKPAERRCGTSDDLFPRSPCE